MADQPPQPPYDEDAEFKAWREQRRANQEDDVAPSVTFMELMRQAAARNVAEEDVNEETAVYEQLSPVGVSEESNDATSDDDNTMDIPRAVRPRRRAERRSDSTMLGGCLRSLIIVLAAAGLTATIFTWATPNDFIAMDVRRGLSASIATEAATSAPTPAETPNWLRRIGIVSGHRGPENDPGAVCPDGLTEASINLAVAQRVVGILQTRGYSVDLLDEFDPRLTNLQADALVSIHANTCQDFGEFVSGFLISFPAARISARGNDTLLVECIATQYARATQLERRLELTRDMTEYHTFSEIHPLTPAAIIELGFMLGDRQLLTEEPDLMAEAISNGVLCFLEPAALGLTEGES